MKAIKTAERNIVFFCEKSFSLNSIKRMDSRMSTFWSVTSPSPRTTLNYYCERQRRDLRKFDLFDVLKFENNPNLYMFSPNTVGNWRQIPQTKNVIKTMRNTFSHRMRDQRLMSHTVFFGSRTSAYSGKTQSNGPMMVFQKWLEIVLASSKSNCLCSSKVTRCNSNFVF